MLKNKEGSTGASADATSRSGSLEPSSKKKVTFQPEKSSNILEALQNLQKKTAQSKGKRDRSLDMKPTNIPKAQKQQP